MKKVLFIFKVVSIGMFLEIGALFSIRRMFEDSGNIWNLVLFGMFIIGICVFSHTYQIKEDGKI